MTGLVSRPDLPRFPCLGKGNRAVSTPSHGLAMGAECCDLGKAWCTAPLPHLCNLFPPPSPPPSPIPPPPPPHPPTPASAASRGPDSDPAARGRPRVGCFLSGVQFLYFMKRAALWMERPKAGKVVISDLQAVLQEVGRNGPKALGHGSWCFECHQSPPTWPGHLHPLHAV